MSSNPIKLMQNTWDPTLTHCSKDRQFFTAKRRQSKFYMAHTDSDGTPVTVQFECLRHFHHISGDMNITCLPNGTWFGQEPICSVDKYMDKPTLVGSIVGSSVFMGLLFLLFDFHSWKKSRTSARRIMLREGYASSKLSVEEQSLRTHTYQRYKPPRLLYPYSRKRNCVKDTRYDRKDHGFDIDEAWRKYILSEASKRQEETNIDKYCAKPSTQDFSSSIDLYGPAKSMSEIGDSSRKRTMSASDNGSDTDVGNKHLFSLFGKLGQAMFRPPPTKKAKTSRPREKSKGGFSLEEI